MELNLTYEMIEHIAISYWEKLRRLQKEFEEIRCSECHCGVEWSTQTEILKNLQKNIEETERIHQIFVTKLNEIDG